MTKQIVLTGGNAGIGYETAKGLAACGHDIIITVRSTVKGEEAVERIKADCENAKVTFVVVDLSDFASIRNGAHEIGEKMSRIDVLIHNAGTFQSSHHVNDAGIEMTFMVNHIAPFYMTQLLLPLLKASDENRIVNMNSDSHYQASFDSDNLNLDRKYNGIRAYARSKLANLLFTYEFERQNPHNHISIYGVHPGLINTDIGAKDASFIHRLLWNLYSAIRGKTPAEGADTSIYLAVEQREQLTSGTYWDDRMIRKSSRVSYNEQHARILWEKSMAICGLHTYF